MIVALWFHNTGIGRRRPAAADGAGTGVRGRLCRGHRAGLPGALSGSRKPAARRRRAAPHPRRTCPQPARRRHAGRAGTAGPRNPRHPGPGLLQHCADGPVGGKGPRRRGHRHGPRPAPDGPGDGVGEPGRGPQLCPRPAAPRPGREPAGLGRTQPSPEDPLVNSLRRLCEKTETEAAARGTRLRCRFDLEGTPVDLPNPYRTTLLRAAQASLANVWVHAKAGTAVVTLSFLGSEVAMDIYDDGAGFDPSAVSGPAGRPDGSGYGLKSLQERVAALAGSLDIESAPGEGTVVAIRLPLGEPRQGAKRERYPRPAGRRPPGGPGRPARHAERLRGHHGRRRGGRRRCGAGRALPAPYPRRAGGRRADGPADGRRHGRRHGHRQDQSGRGRTRPRRRC